MLAECTVNLDRIKNNLFELSQIGHSKEDHGIYRQGFSDADMMARRWLMAKLDNHQFDSMMDGAGNVIGRHGEFSIPSVSIGSHLDSVPCGGIYDGALGVIVGLECLQVVKENNIQTKHPLELIAFSEEEGRFGGMFGVQALCGKITPDWLEEARDVDGIYLKDAMKKQGMDHMKVLDAYRAPDTIHAFLEIHIEQGPVLEKLNKTIGVVEGISGVFKWIIRLIGKADHAGTAPMDMRSDAFMGLADFAHEIPRIIEEEGTDKSRLTVGKVELKPGFPHTVPGEAMFTLVGRDVDQKVMDQLASTCRKVLSTIARRYNLMFEYHEMGWLDPCYCDSTIVNLFIEKSKELNLDYHVMPSGAGHDTQFMTELTKAGMIFVPSVGGVSHAPDELSHWSDIEKGANLLLQTALSLASNENQ